MATLQESLATGKANRRRTLTEVESKELLKASGIPVVETRAASTKREAVALAKALGYPVVLKVLSPDITHKSDVGGVRVGLTTAFQVREAFDQIAESVRRHSPQARVHGVSVQHMAPRGVEVIIGMTRDPQFGPVLMFGLGGIMVEVLRDVSFRLVPLTQRDARQMVREIKGYPLLEGYRGQEPVSLGHLEEALIKFSNFVERTPAIEELDLNPIFAYSDGLLAVDARLVLEE